MAPACTPETIERIATLLKDTNLHDLLSPQNVIILKDSATVEQSLKTLASKRILSSPVVAAPDADAKPPGCGCLAPLFAPAPPGAHWPQEKGLAGNHQILGFLDVRDVLSSFLAELEGHGNLPKMKMLQKMRLLEEQGSSFATTAIKDLKVFGGDGDFLHTSEAAQTSVLDVIVNGLLNPKERGAHQGKHIVTGTVHRVAIYDNHFRINNIISQTDIIKFIFMNKGELGDLATKTAAELGWASRPVVTLGPDVSAIEAMLLMNQKQISALAVVDGVGKIIGNFSVSEMRTIMAEHFGALALPVGEFLALEHGTEFQGYSHIHEQEVVQSKGHKFITDRIARARPRTPGEEVGQNLILVTPQATMIEILDKIVSHRIHRVYVIDELERPVGVVTCTDVVRLIISLVQPAALPASRPSSAKQLQQLEQQEAEQQQHDQQKDADAMQQ
uniref:CBS domain-containing protein n=1 Tax=Tetradesmus obliquus TaxID=3088 RepID=A0A383WDK4_TETOB|eukprot:jgi/Sobl393_1/5797/SZX75340.1